MKNLFFIGLSLFATSFSVAQCDCPPLSERTDVVISDDGTGTSVGLALRIS